MNGKEIELKFGVIGVCTNLRKILQSIGKVENEHVDNLTNIYFDTNKRDFYEMQAGLRIRKANEYTEQTLKIRGSNIGGVHVRNEYNARERLAAIVNSSVRKILGQITLTELLSQQRNQIMKQISEAVKADAEQIGVSVADVRIRRADLPIDVLQAINARMKTERERDAKEFRAQGQQEAQQIRAEADKETAIIVAEADKAAQIIRGEGDEQAILIWNNAANQDPEFYAFYRSLEAYRKALANGETSLVIAPDGEFFDFFSQSKAPRR